MCTTFREMEERNKITPTAVTTGSQCHGSKFIMILDTGKIIEVLQFHFQKCSETADNEIQLFMKDQNQT